MSLIYSAWSDVVRIVAGARAEYLGRSGLIGPSVHHTDARGRQRYLVIFTFGAIHPDGTHDNSEEASFYPEDLAPEPDQAVVRRILDAHAAVMDRYHGQGEIVRVVDPQAWCYRRVGWVLDANHDDPAGRLLFRVEFAYGRLHGDGTEEESENGCYLPGQVARETDPEIIRATQARHTKSGEYERGAVVRVHDADHDNAARQSQTGRVIGFDMTEGDKFIYAVAFEDGEAELFLPREITAEWDTEAVARAATITLPADPHGRGVVCLATGAG